MLRPFLITLLLTALFNFKSFGAVPENDDVKKAYALPTLSAYCSADGAYNNLEATASNLKKGSFWNSEGKDVWYKFTCIATDVSINVTGKAPGNSNTLTNPLIAIYTLNGNVLTEQIGSMVSSNNLTVAYKGGLTIGETYYIRVSAENDATGTFKMCANNYNPPKKAGQDCISASLLCHKSTFTEQGVIGAGNNNQEATGTCLTTESNSAWYTWTAANNGTLTFSITPTAITDDIDWVLYDLGPNGTCSKILPENALRCAAGNGINCIPSYYITGMDMTSTDLTEQKGCVPGQDGWVKYIDMIQGHVYALLIDNVSSHNNGFTIAFGGTGEFLGPTATIAMEQQKACTIDQSFTFSAEAENYNNLKWSFGTDASLSTANGLGPYQITYSSTGFKTVVLEASSNQGCDVVKSYGFYVAFKPETPVIIQNKTSFCLKDSMILSVPEITDARYKWSGPENFSDTLSTVKIPLTRYAQAGSYAVVVTLGTCSSEPASVLIPRIVHNPIASFTAAPGIPGKFSVPTAVQFINQSAYADSYEWNFGDGQISAEVNPSHIYSRAGNYTVSLNAYTENGCVHTLSLSDLVLLDAGSLLIPNSFSPNGDGINDFFNVNVTNLKKYTLRIFNRYGETIFSTNNIFNSWDGTWHGKPMPAGAYFYTILATDLFDKEVRYSGSITLIR